MTDVLFAWVGTTDIRAAGGELPEADVGPIAQALTEGSYAQAVLLDDHEILTSTKYKDWIQARTKAKVTLVPVKLQGPTHFGDIYENASKALLTWQKTHGIDPNLTFHISPGTPAMAAVWIILAKTRFPARLIESSRQFGVRTVSIPFDISAEFLPDLLRKPDEQLKAAAEALPPASPEFHSIIFKSRSMQKTVTRARMCAPRNVPVLLLGESGTGKELFARAIHSESPRKGKPFIAVNCGAIPSELVDSELFGHIKGAFTNAVQDRRGYVREAEGGTLFLDEIGELPLLSQVRLLRVLQEGEVTPVGANKPVKANVRVIAATNRNLLLDVQQGTFRSDLFHRLAVAVLQIPALRNRDGDLGLLIDYYLSSLNKQFADGQPAYVHKKLSVGAKNLLLRHPWPGNIRELMNTLQRAMIWSTNETISADEISDVLLPLAPSTGDTILGRQLGNGLRIEELISEVARHYLVRAMEDANGNKTLAAELIGLANYQTLSNWLDRYGVETQQAQPLRKERVRKRRNGNAVT